MGDPPSIDAAPTGAALAASRQAIAEGGEQVARGARAFTDDGCDRCHAIAPIGATGDLGPRLDTSRSSARCIEQQVVVPQAGHDPAYANDLMPRDPLEDLGQEDVAALAAFVAAASAR